MRLIVDHRSGWARAFVPRTRVANMKLQLWIPFALLAPALVSFQLSAQPDEAGELVIEASFNAGVTGAGATAAESRLASRRLTTKAVYV
jgi:hypothetical protein